ncbi:MAG: two-component sensor histidine kinase [Flavobacteriaceae bacterium]|nr:two-component sensor histidine kinase [Flavobacteriaceae bacterium]|tara:strand:+ start:21272 stop:22435 length:1164 start_codon:yes stop_codon:yes gene_type:complete
MISKVNLNLKKIWPLIFFIIVVLILWNTYILFQTVKNEERKKIKLWAMAQKELIESNNPSNITFEVLQQVAINPIIQVDNHENIIGYKNIDWNPNRKDSLELYNELKKIKKENEPILIKYQDSINKSISVNQKVYYGDSLMLKKLQYYPLALLLIILLFAIVIYFIFWTAKISEQNRLWASMAKETAHQIGTPLTSLFGWITLFKEKKDNSNFLLSEIEKDLKRLKIITNRFSKIGSSPKLNPTDIVFITNKTLSYLSKRLSKLIIFNVLIPKKKILIPLDPELYSWTLENIIKNGIDSMKGKGNIKFLLTEGKDVVNIEITDYGSGIEKNLHDKIFLPGYTSKKTGWGLGLSLAKRIIVDYHKGLIEIKKSLPGKGTTIKIVLKKN